MKYVHKKTAKGLTYYYFDTGMRDDRGRRILRRLPDARSRAFGDAYKAALAQRTKNAGAEGAKTFDWAVKLFERSSEFRAKSANTRRHYSLHLGYANANFRNKHGRSWPLAIVTAEHVVQIRDKYADHPGKANAILRAIGALYHWAGKPGRRYVKENIVAGVEGLDMGEHQHWPEWLIEEALADPAIRLPVALLYFTGQRIGDAVTFGRGHISRGVLSFTQQKTGTSLKIAVHKRLAEIIDADAPKDAMVFLLGEKGNPATASGIRQRIQKWALARGQRIVPHGLRKSAVNALLEAGCSSAEVSAITGQSLQMVEHYAKGRDTERLASSAILKFEQRNNRRT
jgi:integrase